MCYFQAYIYIGWSQLTDIFPKRRTTQNLCKPLVDNNSVVPNSIASEGQWLLFGAKGIREVNALHGHHGHGSRRITQKNKVKYADISTLPNTDAKVWKGISRNWWNLQKMDGGHTQYIQSKMMKPPKIDVAIPQQKTMTIWTCSIFFFTAYGGVLWSIGVPKWGGIPKSSSHPVIHTILVEQKPNDFGFQAGVDRPGQ